MLYYKYDNTTGIITSSGMSMPTPISADDFVTQAEYQDAVEQAELDLLERLSGDNDTAVKGTANPNTQKVDVTTGNLVDYTPPAEVIDYAGINRALRDNLLSKCDWTQTLDAPITSTEQTNWANYRQDLRDLPDTVAHFTTDYLTAGDLPTPP